MPYGLGRHAVVIPDDDRMHMEEIGFWRAFFFAGIGLGVLRISVATTLLRLNKDLKWYRWSLYGVMGSSIAPSVPSDSIVAGISKLTLSAIAVFVVLYTIQACIWLFVYCTPFSGWWEFQWKNPMDPRCHPFGIFLGLTYWNICEYSREISRLFLS